MKIPRPQAVRLDEEQQQAIAYNQSTVLIAGPGSGKTRSLTGKAYELVRHQHVHSLIALTFTRNAAKELNERVPWIEASTIHSFCLRTLRRNTDYQFTDYDNLLKDFIQWNTGHRVGYQWVLVDEAQDLNQPEMDVVKSLTRDKVFAVGDPEQSIYGFGGSLGGEALFEIRRHYGCKTFRLLNNYRSTSVIVNLLEELVSRGLIAKGDGHVKGTAVFTRTNRQLNLIGSALTELGLDFSTKVKGKGFVGDVRESRELKDLCLMTIHCSKGLEFQRVFCWNWGERFIERNLYYVAMSRASQRFELVNTISSLYELLKGNA